jgi:hypothetical protein
MPVEMTDAMQARFRAQGVVHANRSGFSQSFRGVVGTNATVTLHTSWPINWQPSMSEPGMTSELTLYTSTNRVGTGTVVSQGEKVASPKPNESTVRRVWGTVSRLNRIQGIIRAPIDQVLQMEVVYGDHMGSNSWKGIYASGKTYRWTSSGSAAAAMIKLTCNNPLNPGPFNFMASLRLISPTPTQPSQPAQRRQTWGDWYDNAAQELQRRLYPWRY